MNNNENEEIRFGRDYDRDFVLNVPGAESVTLPARALESAFSRRGETYRSHTL